MAYNYTKLRKLIDQYCVSHECGYRVMAHACSMEELELIETMVTGREFGKYDIESLAGHLGIKTPEEIKDVFFCEDAPETELPGMLRAAIKELLSAIRKKTESEMDACDVGWLTEAVEHLARATAALKGIEDVE